MAHGLVINSLSWLVTSDNLFSKFKRATPVAGWKMSSRRFCSMIKRAAIVLAAVTLSFGLALAPKAFADDMKKDSMSKEDSMSKDSMKKDSMSKDSMSKDAMSNDSMSKDGMKKDEMKK
jgi:pentapeptide MXKDX repeat protein